MCKSFVGKPVNDWCHLVGDGDGVDDMATIASHDRPRVCHDTSTRTHKFLVASTVLNIIITLMQDTSYECLAG